VEVGGVREPACRYGQVRVVAAVIAIVVVIAAYMLASGLTRPIRSLYYRETADLRRLAYNVLDNMASAGVFEELILNDPKVLEAISAHESVNCSEGEPGWVDRFRALLSTVLPSGLVFTARVGYYHPLPNGSLVYCKLHCKPITLGEVRFVEAESVTYTYTTSGGAYGVVILRVDLVVGYEG